MFWNPQPKRPIWLGSKSNFLWKVTFWVCEENEHLQKGAEEVHNQKVRACFINITVEAVLNYQIAHCAATKVLFVLLCYRTNTTNTTIFLSNISKLKHNQIIRVQTQKHNFKINQFITIKAKKKKEKKKTEDRSHLTHLDWVGDEDDQQHEDESSLVCSWIREKMKIFLSQREFWNQVKRERERERAGERKREWSSLECSE